MTQILMNTFLPRHGWNVHVLIQNIEGRSLEAQTYRQRYSVSNKKVEPHNIQLLWNQTSVWPTLIPDRSRARQTNFICISSGATVNLWPERTPASMTWNSLVTRVTQSGR